MANAPVVEKPVSIIIHCVAVECIDDHNSNLRGGLLFNCFNFMLQFNLLEPRPVFTDYAARMTDRDAFRRARDIDGKLIAEMQAQQAAAQPA